MPQADATLIDDLERDASRPGGGRKPPRPEMARRVMDVEALLTWAFCEELPKDRGLGGSGGEACAVSPMFAMGAFGTRVDFWNREPGFPSAMGPPHPDALLVEQALADVATGSSRVPCLSGEIDLGADLRAFGVDEVEAMRVALVNLPANLARCAKQRERPFWTQNMRPYPVRASNGVPKVVRWEPRFTEDLKGEEVEHQVMVQVEARRKDEYPFGAYCPLEISPDPKTVAGERAEYLAWWGALRAIAEALSGGKLSTISVLAPGAPQRPWLGEEDLGATPRVFEDLSARVYGREQRETAAAHRALGLRGSIGGRGAARTRGMPTRTVRRPASSARAACAAG